MCTLSRWLHCCRSAHRVRCRRSPSRPPCCSRACCSAGARRGSCANCCPVARPSNPRTCCPTAVTASRCDPTAPAGAAGGRPASTAGATTPCATPLAASFMSTGRLPAPVLWGAWCPSRSIPRPTRTPTTAAPTMLTGCALMHSGPSCGPTPQSGSARRTTLSSARWSCATCRITRWTSR